MSGRPTDWYVLDLDADPTPGDPYGIRELARRFLGLSSDASDAAGRVRGAASGDVLASWVGDSGDAYREEIGGLPGDLDKLSMSYGMAGRALTGYASALDGAQAEAGRALVAGREARARLATAQSGLTSARTAEAGSAQALDQARHPSSIPAGAGSSSGPPPPEPAAVSAAVRNHNAATTRLTQAQAAVNGAQGDIDAARRLALSAKGLREQAEARAEHELRAASDAGIHNKKWWQKLGDALAKGWHVLVEVAKVVVLVLGVVALIIGGPLAWVVFAAALVVLADTLVKYAQGKATLWDVALAALACIPMTKGLTSLGEIRAVLAEGRGLLGVGRLIVGGARGQLAEMVSAVRGLGRGLTTVIKEFPTALADSIKVVEGAAADGSRIPLGISLDGAPLRDLMMAAAADARGASGGALPKGWTRSSGPRDFSLMSREEGKGVVATLGEDGTFELAVEAGKDSSIRGRAMFDAAMAHFGANVKAIQGAWYYGDNLAKVNRLVAAGTPLDEAVTMTWTAGQAARYGFVVPEITELVGPAGSYEHIVVLFRKAEG